MVVVKSRVYLSRGCTDVRKILPYEGFNVTLRIFLYILVESRV